ncbi:hypothetical protein [Streptomyces cyaneofuscatus]|uniref:hypothetical protein n=1 Tax=Streptomyces cyaneofuscatus TaxID=66883 RepID=UPI0036DB6783
MPSDLAVMPFVGGHGCGGCDDETALVLGSFRRRANGDGEFVTGGRGYRGGLEELVQDYGIEVE